MKKLSFIAIVLVLMTSLFMGCSQPTDDGDDPVVIVPPTFEETVAGKFWSLDMLERYQVTTRTEADVNPYALGVCFYFGEDGYLTFWEDANDDGILSPSEEIGSSLTWSIEDGVLTIDGTPWGIVYFTATGWAIEADVTGTLLGDVLGNDGAPYEGWIRLHYVPCDKLWDGPRLTGEFAFVFDDMHDTNAEWTKFCKRYFLDVEFDWMDGFYFTTGTPADSYIEDDPTLGVHVFVLSFYDGPGNDIDTAIIIASETYGVDVYVVPDQLDPMAVYDMTFSTDSADVGLFEFVSRVDGSGFEVDVTLDKSEMGAIIIRGVDDCDVNVVNP